jgi:hypothetical protein
MHAMTFSELCWFIIAIFIGCMCICVCVGYQWGREDTADPAIWERGTDPYPEPDDAVSTDETWARLLAAWASDDEETGIVDLSHCGPCTLPEVCDREDLCVKDPEDGIIAIPRRHKRLADTGELRALAYAGDIDAIMDEVAAYTTELDKEGPQ